MRNNPCPTRPAFANSTRCPHCRSRCKSIRTRELSDLVREVHYQCLNEACGFIFAAQIEVVRTVLRSLNPNPDVAVPDRRG